MRWTEVAQLDPATNRRRSQLDPLKSVTLNNQANNVDSTINTSKDKERLIRILRHTHNTISVSKAMSRCTSSALPCPRNSFNNKASSKAKGGRLINIVCITNHNIIIIHFINNNTTNNNNNNHNHTSSIIYSNSIDNGPILDLGLGLGLVTSTNR